ncbi:AraC family transcriptional regulator [Desulfosporosinus sp. PR]|uniref:AraC family transcriptional regulator n=1 Tax=Candidatus Desulfosporosinus nitrosoreducens TaxID=3401928 RepID=UPI0027F5FBFE|nr:AraC family transcriptional regulator [Desulfosporosinus sp. PR]MDQ7092585.1 AraC family transcriptional regulator [Desulfosporosinus sp. PR]
MLQHLDEGITIKEVENHFHYSEFYFSRIFKTLTGESVYAFIKHLKMDQSAIDIKLKKHKAITDIGLDYGYSASNYSSAFRQHHRLSPTEFRKSIEATSIANPFHPGIVDYFETFDDYDARMKIVLLQDVQVIYERVFGNYDDPTISSMNRCICDLCITTDNTCKLDNITMIKGGKFATCRFEGEIKDIFL